MTPRDRLAAASQALKPLQQGELDGLCGLYAIINAIRLALYPDCKLTRPESAALFAAGITELRKARSLPSTILTGIHDPSWRRAGDAIVFEATRRFGESFVIDRFRLTRSIPDRELLRLIRLIIRAGNPVLLRVQGTVDHWTVVCRFSKSRLMLFDSSGLRWLSVTSLAVATGRRTARYRVPLSGLAVLLRSLNQRPP